MVDYTKWLMRPQTLEDKLKCSVYLLNWYRIWASVLIHTAHTSLQFSFYLLRKSCFMFFILFLYLLPYKFFLYKIVKELPDHP